MGLLDDAIREHLELKLQHGADADEVSRQEHEALGPVSRDRAPAEEAEPLADAAEDDFEPPTELSPVPVDETERDPEPEDVYEDDEPEPAATVGPALGETEEWGFEEAHEEEDDGEPAEGEDVLEQTPEFLTETPEHDRLWFEQKPPRDFDFDG